MSLLSRLLAIWRAPYQITVGFSERDAAIRSVAGRLLRERYATVVAESNGYGPLHEHEVKVFSQHGEDGIILYLLSLVGCTDRRFVEFGCGNGRECNTANLSINFGWSGLLMDIDASNVRSAKEFYRGRPKVRVGEHAIDAQNINHVISAYGIVGEIDLLSIDIDGNDYWVWRALEVLNPRVVVIEYNPSFGPERSVTVPYRPDFARFQAHASGLYHGASLAALEKLGHEKGYRLVGCDSSGTNAFFVRIDLAPDLPRVERARAFTPAAGRLARRSQAEQEALVLTLPCVNV